MLNTAGERATLALGPVPSCSIMEAGRRCLCMTWAAVNPAVNPGLLPQRCHIKNPQQVWWQAQRDGFSLAHKQERPVKDKTMDKALFPTVEMISPSEPMSESSYHTVVPLGLWSPVQDCCISCMDILKSSGFFSHPPNEWATWWSRADLPSPVGGGNGLSGSLATMSIQVYSDSVCNDL